MSGSKGEIVFSGVGKGEHEMRRALEARVACFNVESAGELERLNAVAGALGVIAPVSIRVNPDVDAKTHPYISTGLTENKFGIPSQEIIELMVPEQQQDEIQNDTVEKPAWEPTPSPYAYNAMYDADK